MRNTVIGFAFLLASATAFAVGDITAAKSAENDISAALGRDSATGQPYLRVYVVNSAGLQGGLATASGASASSSHTVTLNEGDSFAIKGTLTSATATGRPCDLIVFDSGQSQLLLIDPSGTPLNDRRVSGTVSASGNPLGYSCSLVLKYATP